MAEIRKDPKYLLDTQQLIEWGLMKAAAHEWIYPCFTEERKERL